MKAKFARYILLFAAFLSFAVSQSVYGAVAFTVTPNTVSNTYRGTITLQVTGLNPGESVVVQKFADANSNGIIDSADILFQQFNLTDASNSVIAGITNFNVPGDTDTTSGQITAKLQFGQDFTQEIVGKYLFKLSSPSNHFTPMTNSFSVTNFPYLQKFTGTVLSNGVAVSYASVIVFQPTASSDLNPVAGVVANNSGVYTIQMPVGNYGLAGFQTNCIANTTTAANITLGAGATITTNLALISTTQSISGHVVDTNNNSIGLPGLLLAVQTRDKSLLGISFTDTNGNFVARVNSNQWGIGPDTVSVALHGYVELGNKTVVDTTGGSVSGVTIALHKATALFYGTVKDSLGNPLSGVVDVEADDNNIELYDTDGYTDANGNYVAGIVGGLGVNDPWQADIDNSKFFTNYNFSQPLFNQNGGTNVSSGQAVQANFLAISAPNRVTGMVEDVNGQPIVGVGVNANTTINGTNFSASTDTDSNGNYVLNLATADWQFNLNCCDSCGDGLNSATYQCPNTIDNGTISGPAEVDFQVGLVGTFVLSGTVFDPSFVPVANVHVDASGNGANYETSTDNNGFYQFSLPDGGWNVSVDCSDAMALGFSCNDAIFVDIADSDSTNNNIFLQPPALQIISPLPPGAVGAAYFAQLQVSGGVPPYTWQMVDGSLPDGILVNTNGTVTGLPTDSGTFTFTVEVDDNGGNFADEEFSLQINSAPLPDYDFYYVTKTKLFEQLDSRTLVPNPGTPYRAVLGVFQYAFGTVSNAIGDLPTGSTATFQPGLGQELDATTTFQSQAALDAAYPNGEYAFVINGQHNGFQLLSVDLPNSTNYPVTPQVSNFAAAQTVNVSNAFTLQWLLDTNGPNDFVWFYIIATNTGSVVFSSPYPPGSPGALNGNSTSTQIPASTLLTGVTYQGNLLFVRTVETNGVGFANLCSQTVFNLITTGKTVNTTPPHLGVSGYSAANGFSLTLTGAASQSYAIQVSTNLTTWSNLTVVPVASTNPVMFTDSGAKTNSKRYYRAQLQ